MGRPLKNTADYFPHHVKGGQIEQIRYILEQKWGNDGYAFWYKLLELLCLQEGHYYDCSKEASWIYLSAYTRLDCGTVENIIHTLVGIGELDRELWEKNRVIWCPSLLEDLKPLYEKRTYPLPDKPSTTEVSSESNSVSDAEKEESAPKKKTTKKDKPEKVKYAEFVTMTPEEYQKLVSEYGQAMTDRMISVLDNYKGSKGKTYKNDYRAILSWVVDRVKEEDNRNGGTMRNAGQNNEYNGFKPSVGFRK